MVFFRCIAHRAERADREQLRQEAENLSAELSDLSFKLYQDTEEESLVFTTSVTASHVHLGVMAPNPVEAEKQAKTYLHWLPFLIDDYKPEEITCGSLLNLLAQADHKDYIPDRNDVLEMFGMEPLTARGR